MEKDVLIKKQLTIRDAFVKILGISIDVLEGNTIITYGVYKDQTASDSGSDPLDVQRHIANSIPKSILQFAEQELLVKSMDK